jgi:hypothetical protein
VPVEPKVVEASIVAGDYSLSSVNWHKSV